MSHDHHKGSDGYYLEQLWTIGVCGAFAGAAITLYYWQRPILITMFGQASLFHDFVVWSGMALLGLVVLRAITLWSEVGRPALAETCNHDHSGNEHDCDQDHEHGHNHMHNHDHEHSHDHGHHEHAHSAVSCPSGHDHGAAPWRYVVLLVPIILFLLGLPNKGPKATAGEVAIGQTDPQAAPAYGSLIGAGPLPLQQLVLAAAVLADPSAGRVYGMDFKSLEAAAQDEYSRKDWQGKTVRVVGQFAPHPRNDRVFSLVRFRIQCCAADAVQYRIPALCRESIAGISTNQWVEVTGRVQFQQDPSRGGFMTVLLVPRRQNVVLTDPDPNPYIQ